MASAIAPLVSPAVRKHTSTVIVAHGLGDSGAGWMFLADSWRASNKFPETKFVFPNAPRIPITGNMGMQMPGWYDISAFEEIANRNEDEAGILRSQRVFHNLIEDEVKAGIPGDRIVLGGFSQGGAMSLMAGTTSPVRLGGIFGLSCYLLLKDKVRDLIPADSPNKNTPIFMGHGEEDPLVRLPWGRATAQQLTEWGWTVDFKTYPGLPHSAAPQEIDDLESWLKQRIPDEGEK